MKIITTVMKQAWKTSPSLTILLSPVIIAAALVIVIAEFLDRTFNL